MRKLIYSMTVSLDGYIAGPDGAIDWTVPDEELFLFHTQQVQEIGVHLCGRRLYETMVYWETAEESPLAKEHLNFAQIWKALPKVVFSTTLQSVVGNTRLARDGVGEEVSRLKEQPGKRRCVSCCLGRHTRAPPKLRPMLAATTRLWASYRRDVWQLAQFERKGAYLRVAAGLIMFMAIPALPLAVLYASVYVADARPAQLAFGVLLIAATTTAGWLCKRRLWEQPVRRRLIEWQSHEPGMNEVGVAIADADISAACVVLMRAHLYPWFSRHSNPIPDAPGLDRYLGVVLPSILPQVEFDEVAERTRQALRHARIRARMVGVDVP